MLSPTLDELPSPPPQKKGWPWTEAGTAQIRADPSERPWPRVTVVTPSLNQGQYIEEAIRSVLLQGYPDLEYIVMDGGSTDATVEVIRKYERWIAHWVSEPDAGQSQAINSGWARGSGKVLAYLNSDDAYLKDAIFSGVQALQATAEAGMAYGTAVVVDEAGRELRRWEAKPFSLRAMLLEGNVVPQAAAFYTRRSLDTVGYLANDLEMIMDYELSLRVGLAFPSVCIPRMLARFRDHPRSKSRNQFATTGRELVNLVKKLSTDPLTAREVGALRQASLSRIHYEWALSCIAHDQRDGSTGRHLRESLRLHPAYAMGRPMQSAYILKEILREVSATQTRPI